MRAKSSMCGLMHLLGKSSHQGKYLFLNIINLQKKICCMKNEQTIVPFISSCLPMLFFLALKL